MKMFCETVDLIYNYANVSELSQYHLARACKKGIYNNIICAL